MTRAVFALMAGLLCALAGVKYAATLKGEAIRQARWVQRLHHLALLLEEGALSIPEALMAVAEDHQMPDTLLRDIASSMGSEPLLTPEASFLRHCGEWHEKALLQRMFSRLGRGSKESRCQAVTQAAREMELLAQRSAAGAEKDVKLWQTLGLIGGTCLTILLL